MLESALAETQEERDESEGVLQVTEALRAVLCAIAQRSLMSQFFVRSHEEFVILCAIASGTDPEGDPSAPRAIRAVLVGLITTNGMREFVLYSATADWIAAFHERLERAIRSHRVDCMAKRDRAWAAYRNFVP